MVHNGTFLTDDPIPYHMVDYVEALKRPFSDLNKLLIGLVLGSIPIVNLTVTGYTLVSTGFTKVKVEKDSLPEWKNYRDLFMKGLVSALIGILVFLPNTLVLFSALGTVASSPVLNQVFGGISPETWNRFFAGEITDIQMQDWFAQNWTKFIPLLVSVTPYLLLGFLLALIASYILPVIILGWLKEDRVGAGFRWEVLTKAFTFDYLVNWIVVGIFGLILSALLGWIPFLGSGITMYVTGVFSYTVFAEVYERA
jgi:hypothetical protein